MTDNDSLPYKHFMLIMYYLKKTGLKVKIDSFFGIFEVFSVLDYAENDSWQKPNNFKISEKFSGDPFFDFPVFGTRTFENFGMDNWIA